MRRSRGAAGGVEQVRRVVVEDSFALTSLQQLAGRLNKHMDQTGEQMIEFVCETCRYQEYVPTGKCNNLKRSEQSLGKHA